MVVAQVAAARLNVEETRLRRCFSEMLRIRMVEERIAEKYAEEKMRCPVHLSIGQEGVAVGVSMALREEDQIVSTHRCHAHYLAKGGDLRAMLSEIHGRASGCCGGRGGSMHLFDPTHGVLLSAPIVASSVPVGVGAALGFKQQLSDAVCAVYAGDATLEEGVFHEAANFAALHKLPVVFVCENNLYSVYTPLSSRQPARPLVDVARAHAMPSTRVDGNDVDAVYGAAAEAVVRARVGEGPTLLVCDTYRWREHCGPNYDNHVGYRSEQELAAWKEHCPIERVRRKLVGHYGFDEAQQRAIAERIRREIEEAFAFAEADPFPESASAGAGVYA